MTSGLVCPGVRGLPPGPAPGPRYDGNGLELAWDRPPAQWPRYVTGGLVCPGGPGVASDRRSLIMGR